MPYKRTVLTKNSGGRSEFKWEDVKNDAQRENYLGHSLMAPVGRWQQNRDLSWYAKGDTESKDAEAARIKEEKRKLKEAEEDAMLAAMGLPVPVRNNANLTPLGERAHEADVKDVIEEKAKDGEDDDKTKRRDRKEHSRRHRDDGNRERRRRHRSRSRSHDRERRHKHRDRSRSHDGRRDGERERHKRRHRSRSREHRRRDGQTGSRNERNLEEEGLHPRSRSRERRRHRDSRSRSPYKAERRKD